MDDQHQPATDPFIHANMEQPELNTAAVRLRAFEDEHLGPDAVRLHGDRVERGSGSLYQRLSPAHRKAHAALEKTVETERKLSEANAALAVAENEHRAAVEAADKAVQHLSDGPDTDRRKGPTVQEYVAAGHRAENYPPHGYPSRSTPEEIAAAIMAQNNAGK